MAIRLPSVLSAKHILRRSNLFSNQAAAPASQDVPKGYFAVYVGEGEKKRFVIPVSLLNQPSFQELLSIAEEEFGFSHPMGGLTIPCTEDMFINLTADLHRL
ncbi:auxin-responsive protein SAUR23-like [Gastrolobium bilobum]|uniref:auxin-responsive protein SAUR23-like n=1 Tax=Gastrolobium bilobum TaxID=150636 RepID=UPI002AB0AF11|nr:auxin-responsive protein SAUR23-like [Gastrolobium bilobum]